MAISGISLWLASIFTPFVNSRNVAYVSGFTTMLFWCPRSSCPFSASRPLVLFLSHSHPLAPLPIHRSNVFETLPATLIVFKMIDSVPQWRPAHIAAAGALAGKLSDARRAALSAVIFGSNFGANTACIGSLGGLMMRRLALQQGVTVTNGMLLKQGIPVMIPTMLTACFVLVHQTSI